jgi:serine/threonine-protein kinase
VKPSNILVGSGDKVKLTDFGIASRTGDPKLTATGMALGSLYYMSPEQLRAETLDARSDLYSVGATLYEMITGIRPIQGDSFYAVLRAHTDQRPRPPIQLVPELTPSLSHMLEKAPEARFQSAEDFRAALISLGAGSRLVPAAVTISEAVPVPGFSLSAVPSPAAPATVPGESPKAQSDTGSKSWDPTVLETARKHLAVYIGPMAKILVSRAAKKARTVEELYQALAAEIASPSEKEKFLRSQPF